MAETVGPPGRSAMGLGWLGPPAGVGLAAWGVGSTDGTGGVPGGRERSERVSTVPEPGSVAEAQDPRGHPGRGAGQAPLHYQGVLWEGQVLPWCPQGCSARPEAPTRVMSRVGAPRLVGGPFWGRQRRHLGPLGPDGPPPLSSLSHGDGSGSHHCSNPNPVAQTPCPSPQPTLSSTNHHPWLHSPGPLPLAASLLSPQPGQSPDYQALCSTYPLVWNMADVPTSAPKQSGDPKTP